MARLAQLIAICRAFPRLLRSSPPAHTSAYIHPHTPGSRAARRPALGFSSAILVQVYEKGVKVKLNESKNRVNRGGGRGTLYLAQNASIELWLSPFFYRLLFPL